MIVTETTSSTFEPAPAGSFLARLCRLVDLGSQTSEYQGETKTARKVLFVWEILDPDVHREDGGAYTVAKRFTRSLHEKAALRQALASWRGLDFSPAELRGFDLQTVLGKLCYLGVVHVEKGDRTYANVSSLMKPPRGLTGTEPTETLVHFDLAAPDWKVFDALPPRLQEQIASSPEYKAARAVKPATTAAPSTGFDDMDDDIPF